MTQNSAHAFAIRPLPLVQKAALVVGASLFVALCAQPEVRLPFTPVPLSLANFGVLAVGLALGSRGGFAALLLYLGEGAMGLPVFSGGAAGALHLIGPTGGYLIAYPFAAFLAGFIAERGNRKFLRLAIACVAAEIVVFAGGIGWLALLTHHTTEAVQFALYPFVFAEVMKVLVAAGAMDRWKSASALKV